MTIVNNLSVYKYPVPVLRITHGIFRFSNEGGRGLCCDVNDDENFVTLRRKYIQQSVKTDNYYADPALTKINIIT